MQHILKIKQFSCLYFIHQKIYERKGGSLCLTMGLWPTRERERTDDTVGEKKTERKRVVESLIGLLAATVTCIFFIVKPALEAELYDERCLKNVHCTVGKRLIECCYKPTLQMNTWRWKQSTFSSYSACKLFLQVKSLSV